MFQTLFLVHILYSVSCVPATTKTHCNQISTKLFYCSQKSVLPYAKLCSPLWPPRSSRSHFRLIHPWFKAMKNWHAWFLANYREKKVPTSRISLENAMPKISLWQQQQLSLFFSLEKKCCHITQFCTFQEVRGYSAHPGCVYVAVRSLTDVVKVRVPQPEPLHIHLLHSQATLRTAKWHTDMLLSSTILLFKSSQCSSTTPCNTVVSYFFYFSVQRTC